MVFMEDSERAAAIAQAKNLDTGLHLNFTTLFSARALPCKLLEAQQRVASYLRRHRFAKVMFNPALRGPFEYLVATQLDEFLRLYGREAKRIDGHHHMHLCENVLFAGLLPAGTLVRRHFTFQSGEKGLINRLYRSVIDARLARRHELVDFLFPLVPMRLARLQRIVSLARHSIVELETHPVNCEEYQFLARSALGCVFDIPIANAFELRRQTGSRP